MIPYHELPDEELTALLKSGDHAAFTEIYNRYWKKMFTLAGQKIDDLDEAQEIVQQIFVNLWKRREELDIRSSLASYIAVSVKYRVINALDKRYVRKKHLDNLPFSIVDDSTVELLEFDEMKMRIADIVSKLPEKCRLVFVLSRDEGLSQKQIAEKLGISDKTVESHLRKAIKTLRNGLNSFILTLL